MFIKGFDKQLINVKKDDEKGEKDFSKDIIFHNNACISELSGLLVCYIFGLTLFL